MMVGFDSKLLGMHEWSGGLEGERETENLETEKVGWAGLMGGLPS